MTRERCREQAVYFRNKLREAREAALRDSEGYQQVLFVVEQLGRQKWPGNEKYPRSLGSRCLRSSFIELVEDCVLFNGRTPEDTDFAILYDLVKEGRNDALHVGSVGRNLTGNCVKMSIILEDALMAQQSGEEVETIRDYMVSNPERTYEWQRIGLVRQTMLERSFSHLPFRMEGKWYIISANAICRYLRHPEGGRDRKMKKTLKDAICGDGLERKQAVVKPPSTKVASVLKDICGDEPVLVVQESDLIGIANSFDLM